MAACPVCLGEAAEILSGEPRRHDQVEPEDTLFVRKAKVCVCGHVFGTWWERVTPEPEPLPDGWLRFFAPADADTGGDTLRYRSFTAAAEGMPVYFGVGMHYPEDLIGTIKKVDGLTVAVALDRQSAKARRIAGAVKEGRLSLLADVRIVLAPWAQHAEVLPRREVERD